MKSCNSCLLKSSLDDLGSQTVDLNIDLNSGDTVLRSGNLKVHIAEEVLNTLNIGHRDESVALGDKTAGDAGNGCLDRNAGRH